MGIFALSLTAAEAASKLVIFLWFGIGFGLPLLALSFLSGAAQRWTKRWFARHSRLVNLAGRVLLVAIACYDLYASWELIRIYL